LISFHKTFSNVENKGKRIKHRDNMDIIAVPKDTEGVILKKGPE